MPEQPIDAVHEAIRAAFGARAIESTVTAYPSGAVSITLHHGRHTATIDGHDDEWGVSVDPDETESFTGHQLEAHSLTDALDIARRAIAQD